MNMNLAGIQMVGPDICGFGENTTAELCARWFQLSAVYPFARSHNDYWSIPQEPYSLGTNVFNSALTNLKNRYTLLKQYYSFWILTEGLVPYFCSPAYYPTTLTDIKDQETYDRIISTQFLILDQPLLIAPLLEEGKNEREVYFLNYSKINETRTRSSVWIDLATNTRYLPSSSYTIKNNLGNSLSLYIVEGSTFLFTNVTQVSKTN
jgi:alpha-glucosidase (family GH31 glycosyl hydrolase)